MAKSTGKKSKSGIENLNAIHPNAAGIDIGATEIYIAVPGDRSDDPVRRFDTFTDDLHDAARWLKSCDIDSIAMESTGVYWIPVFQILVEIENHLKEFESRIYIDDIKPPPGKKGGRKPKANTPNFDVKTHMHRILGTDLTLIDGISELTAHVVFTEVGIVVA